MCYEASYDKLFVGATSYHINVNVCMHLSFVAAIDNKNIFTMKISRFMVVLLLYIICIQTAGKDYESTSLSLTLSPDQLVVTFSVPIINDNSVESTEGFRGVLSTSLEQVTLVNSTINVTILDDDEVCIRFNQLEYRASEEEGTATLWVRKEGLNDIPIHVTVSAEDGTATSKSHHVLDGSYLFAEMINKNFACMYFILEHMDYLPAVGGLTFEPRDSVLSLNVTLINDDILEDKEVFHVLLGSSRSQSTYVKFEDYNASVAIIDQDS